MTIAGEVGDPLSPPNRTAPQLTAPEQQVLALAASGWGTDAVANAVGLTPEAVTSSLASIIAKVGARSKIDAVVIAVRRGLVDLQVDYSQPGAPTNGERRGVARPVARLQQWGTGGRETTRRL